MKTILYSSLCQQAYQQIAYQDDSSIPVAGLAVAMALWWYLKRRK